MRFIIICCRRLRVLDTNRGHGGRVPHDAPLHTRRLRATVALAFALMCAIIGVEAPADCRIETRGVAQALRHILALAALVRGACTPARSLCPDV